MVFSTKNREVLLLDSDRISDIARLLNPELSGDGAPSDRPTNQKERRAAKRLAMESRLADLEDDVYRMQGVNLRDLDLTKRRADQWALVRIQGGDTITHLGRALGYEVEELDEANDDFVNWAYDSKDMIRVGGFLLLPNPQPALAAATEFEEGFGVGLGAVAPTMTRATFGSAQSSGLTLENARGLVTTSKSNADVMVETAQTIPEQPEVQKGFVPGAFGTMLLGDFVTGVAMESAARMQGTSQLHFNWRQAPAGQNVIPSSAVPYRADARARGLLYAQWKTRVGPPSFIYKVAYDVPESAYRETASEYYRRTGNHMPLRSRLGVWQGPVAGQPLPIANREISARIPLTGIGPTLKVSEPDTTPSGARRPRALNLGLRIGADVGRAKLEGAKVPLTQVPTRGIFLGGLLRFGTSDLRVDGEPFARGAMEVGHNLKFREAWAKGRFLDYIKGVSRNSGGDLSRVRTQGTAYLQANGFGHVDPRVLGTTSVMAARGYFSMYGVKYGARYGINSFLIGLRQMPYIGDTAIVQALNNPQTRAQTSGVGGQMAQYAYVYRELRGHRWASSLKNLGGVMICSVPWYYGLEGGYFHVTETMLPDSAYHYLGERNLLSWQDKPEWFGLAHHGASGVGGVVTYGYLRATYEANPSYYKAVYRQNTPRVVQAGISWADDVYKAGANRVSPYVNRGIRFAEGVGRTYVSQPAARAGAYLRSLPTDAWQAVRATGVQLQQELRLALDPRMRGITWNPQMIAGAQTQTATAAARTAPVARASAPTTSVVASRLGAIGRAAAPVARVAGPVAAFASVPVLAEELNDTSADLVRRFNNIEDFKNNATAAQKERYKELSKQLDYWILTSASRTPAAVEAMLWMPEGLTRRRLQIAYDILRKPENAELVYIAAPLLLDGVMDITNKLYFKEQTFSERSWVDIATGIDSDRRERYRQEMGDLFAEMQAFLRNPPKPVPERGTGREFVSTAF